MNIPDAMIKETLEGQLIRFCKAVVIPTEKEVVSGKFCWPMGGYTLEVTFDPTLKTVPFVLFKGSSDDKNASKGQFDKEAPENSAFSTWAPSVQLTHLVGDFDTFLRRMTELAPSTLARAPEPALIRDGDVNDEWVEWYRGQDRALTYTAAVHAAIAQIRQHVAMAQAVLDKYVF